MSHLSAGPAVDDPQPLADVTCLGCGCMCDDIGVEVREGRVVAARSACRLGEAWFCDAAEEPIAECLIAGQPADLAAGVRRAAELLSAARYPLVYGLSGTTCEAQRVAVAIADTLGAVIDTPTSHQRGPIGLTFQGIGEVTCTLGEVRNRCDLVIFWGANPVESHPRHLQRYSLDPSGMFVPGGRADRTCVVVDVRRTPTAELADDFLPIRAGGDFEALWTLRALLQNIKLDAEDVHRQTGIELPRWQALVDQMREARFGCIFFGGGLTKTAGGYLNCEAVLALTRDLNAYTRFVCAPLRAGGNVMGADQVLCWQTGYPFGVSLAAGYPRFSPGEFTVVEMLTRREPDAALVIGNDPLGSLPKAARDHLAGIPYVALDWQATATTRGAAVAFHTAKSGVAGGGTVYRTDDITLPLRPVLETSRAEDAAVLAAILQIVAAG